MRISPETVDTLSIIYHHLEGGVKPAMGGLPV